MYYNIFALSIIIDYFVMGGFSSGKSVNTEEFARYAASVNEITIPQAAKAFFGIVPLILAGVMISLLIKRIKEIRSGEEDDLSKY